MLAGRRGYALFLIVTVAGAYLTSFRGVFQLDDFSVIVYNPSVHSWSAYWQECLRGIRPFLKFTYTLNWTLPGGIYGFHAFNLGLHLVNTLLVFLLTAWFLKGCRSRPDEAVLYPAALLTALMFGLHPIQTEAVTYISGRSASLMTLFYLGSLAAYVKGSREGRTVFMFVLSPLFYLLGIATKETAITLPFALVLWEAAAGQDRPFKKVLSQQWVHWALFIIMFAVVLLHSRYRFFILFSLDLRGFEENLLDQIDGMARLISHVTMPNRLNFDPGAPLPATIVSGETAVVVALALALLAGIWRGKAWLYFGVGWFFLHLMVVNIVVPRIDGINDRHFYQASWGIFLVCGVPLSLVLFRFSEKKYLLAVFAVVLSLFLGGYTAARNWTYRSETAIWEDTVLKSPTNARAYNNLGYAYYLEGRKEEARKAYLRALEIDPAFDLAQNNLTILEKQSLPAQSRD